MYAAAQLADALCNELEVAGLIPDGFITIFR
jgi:hypothetical protein